MSRRSAVQTRHRIFLLLLQRLSQSVGHKGVPDAVNVFCGGVNCAGSFSLLIMPYRILFLLSIHICASGVSAQTECTESNAVSVRLGVFYGWGTGSKVVRNCH